MVKKKPSAAEILQGAKAASPRNWIDKMRVKSPEAVALCEDVRSSYHDSGGEGVSVRQLWLNMQSALREHYEIELCSRSVFRDWIKGGEK